MKLLITIGATLGILLYYWEITVTFWVIVSAICILYIAYTTLTNSKVNISTIIVLNIITAIVIGVMYGNFIWLMMIIFTMALLVPNSNEP